MVPEQAVQGSRFAPGLFCSVSMLQKQSLPGLFKENEEMDLRFKLTGRRLRRIREARPGFMKCATLVFLVGLSSAPGHQTSFAQQKKTATANTTEAAVSPEEALKLEAVIATDLGVIRFEFRPHKGPPQPQA